MEFEAEITPADFAEFVRAAQARHQPARLKQSLAVLGAATILVAFATVALTAIGWQIPPDIAGIFFFFGVCFGYVRMMIGSAVGGPQPDGGILGPKRFTVSEDGIQQAAAHSSESVAWPGVYSLYETAQVFVVFTDAAAGMIVPRRAFVGPAQEREFLELLGEGTGLEWQGR